MLCTKTEKHYAMNTGNSTLEKHLLNEHRWFFLVT